MRAIVKVEGHELLRSQLFDMIKDFLNQEAEDQTEFEHESGDMVTIYDVLVKNDSIVVKLNDPEENLDDEEESVE
jgi:hypothetical protein